MRRVPDGTACLRADASEVVATYTRAATETSFSYHSALARRGLTPIDLAVDERGSSSVTTPTFDVTVGATTHTFVVGPSATGCAAPPPWEFARTRDGEIVRVERQPWDAEIAQVQQCGCLAPSGCYPGCGMPRRVQLVFGPLPAGTRYSGTRVAISYGVSRVTVEAAAGTCPSPPPAPVCQPAP